MKKIGFIFFLLSVLISCKKENMGDCFKSTGSTRSDFRTPGTFNSIFVEDGINLFIQQSNISSVEVSAGKNLLSGIRTAVQANVLRISNENKCNWVRSFKRKINVYINSPSLNEINYSGSGTITFLNNFATDELIINMNNASGNINANVSCNFLALKVHSGPADITASGSANELVLYNAGSGNINSLALASNNCLAISRTSGKLLLNAGQELKAEIFESGSIFYTGNPSIELYKTGSGNLIPY